MKKNKDNLLGITRKLRDRIEMIEKIVHFQDSLEFNKSTDLQLQQESEDVNNKIILAQCEYLESEIKALRSQVIAKE